MPVKSALGEGQSWCAKRRSYGAGMGLSDVLAELHVLFQEEAVDVDQVEALLAAYHSNPADWRKYAIFDPYKYTRNLVDAGNGKFNVMILCWGEGMGSSIHDHANAHCFVKVLDGQLLETRFEWPEEGVEEPLKRQREDVHKANAVTYMDDTIGLHRIENPSHCEGAVSLHVYIPAFQECHTFDERTGHARTVGMTFYSSGGVRNKALCS